MFNQLITNSTNINPLAGNPTTLAGVFANDQLAKIRDRLDRTLPQGPYLTESQFAEILAITKKTLSNNRSSNADRYPKPFALGGGRPKHHARSTIIEWLASQELLAMASTVHRCM